MTFKQKCEGGDGSSIGNKYETESRQWGKQCRGCKKVMCLINIKNSGKPTVAGQWTERVKWNKVLI